MNSKSLYSVLSEHTKHIILKCSYLSDMADKVDLEYCEKAHEVITLKSPDMRVEVGISSSNIIAITESGEIINPNSYLLSRSGDALVINAVLFQSKYKAPSSSVMSTTMAKQLNEMKLNSEITVPYGFVTKLKDQKGKLHFEFTYFNPKDKSGLRPVSTKHFDIGMLSLLLAGLFK